MSYLHCPRCERTAWLDATSEPVLHCHHCDMVLAPMPASRARALVGAVRERFEHDMRRDGGRARFVRG
jgi:hypothetical protein